MSAGDDDHDDDAQLKQLRSVWVSMRDEDPPDRGLAALMTAAREKASELGESAKPSWWQRVAATLRRPPVLALATVTLLLGGALIVTQRGAQMKADSVAMTESDVTNQMSDAVQPTGGYVEPSGGTAVSAGSAATVAEPVLPGPPKLRDSRTSATPSVTTTPSPDPVERAEPQLAAPSSKRDAGPRGLGAGGTVPSLSIAQDDAPVTTAAAPREEAAPLNPRSKSSIARTPPPEMVGENRVVSKDTAKAPAPIEQLVKQCESAAARGDCAAVRVIAQKILTSSPSAYKTRLANNSAIHKCMPSPAANASAD